ncbi:MAG: hypothetical protein V7L31_22750 [Nostoc sp.]|uniref:hypothetical protein n=1 Tax=Nostoc sp. TaxID=1180 RepID=UPI002FF2796F
MMERQATIIGNNVSSLVAAIALAAQDWKVKIINPLSSWGGHFGGLTFHNDHFDCGMTFLEFDSFHQYQSDEVLTYNPNLRNDSGRFTSLIKNYVSDLIITKVVPQPKMFFKGEIFGDLMISNDLSILNKLSVGIQEAIQEELLEIIRNPNTSLHAKNKLKNNLFFTNNFNAISLANQGTTFHNLFIESFCKKITCKNTADFLGIYHRGVWLPLYYPETILSQFEIASQVLKHTEFYYPYQGYTGTFVNALLMKAQDNTRINIENTTIKSLIFNGCYQLQLTNDHFVETNNLVWGLDLFPFIKLIQENQQPLNYDKASISICFITILSNMINREFSTLFILDKEFISYRVTNQNICSGSSSLLTKLVVEVNTDLATSIGLIDEAQIKTRIESELIKLHIIESKTDIQYFYCKQWKNSLMIPSQNSYECFNTEKSMVLRKFPNIKLIGNGSGFMSSSLNDQIIQGLQIAKQMEN